jgi:lipopolysaccharide export system permease protein
VALAIGLFSVSVLNPIVAGTGKQYEVLANRHSAGNNSVLSFSQEGLWLRQGSKRGQTVIHAGSSNLDGTRLNKVSFYSFGEDGDPVRRIEAETAELEMGAWVLTGAKEWALDTDNPELGAQVRETLRVASDLTREQIRDSFGEPAGIPVWELPDFIERLDKAGFSARQHRVWFQMELALPLLLVAMVLLGAGLTMRHTRFGGTGILVLVTVLMGFALFFIRNFAQVLGENGQIPVYMAAWSPPVAAICFGFALLLHLEDG